MRIPVGLLISLMFLLTFNAQASAQFGAGIVKPSRTASPYQKVDDRRNNERRANHRRHQGYAYYQPYYPPPYYAYPYPYAAPYPYYAYPRYYGPSGGVSLSLGF